MPDFSLAKLAKLIDERARTDTRSSYTRSLLEGGAPRTAKKFGEECVELIIAALSADAGAVRSEAADVLYHLLVLLKSSNVSLDGVLAELERRTKQSGHEEKAARKP